MQRLFSLILFLFLSFWWARLLFNLKGWFFIRSNKSSITTPRLEEEEKEEKEKKSCFQKEMESSHVEGSSTTTSNNNNSGNNNNNNNSNARQSPLGLRTLNGTKLHVVYSTSRLISGLQLSKVWYGRTDGQGLPCVRCSALQHATDKRDTDRVLGIKRERERKKKYKRNERKERWSGVRGGYS
jgi:hypothetical protein